MYSVHSFWTTYSQSGIELLRDQRVERPALARAVAVHDDDLGRAAGLGAANRGVDLAGVEPAPFLVHRVAAASPAAT